MKRLGALLIALVLIGGAIVANRAIHGKDTADSASSGDGSANLRVVCATEFATACDSLAKQFGDATFTTESPGTTAATLATGDEPAFDLWITSEPWPELAAVRAEAAGSQGTKLLGASGSLASTPLSAVASTSVAATILDACRGSLTGACLLQGGQKLGVAPANETASLLWFAAALTGWPELQDAGTTDIDADDSFLTEFSNAKATAVADRAPITTILLLPKFAVALGLNAKAELAGAARGPQYTPLAFTPPVEARAVVVAADSKTGRAAAKLVTRTAITSAIVATGWTAGGAPTAELPDPAVLDYLATKWSTR